MIFDIFPDIVMTKDGDIELSQLADRHYSRKTKGHALFIGPGKKIILRNKKGTWGFAWRHAKYRMDNQIGWECCFFRNESNELSSKIILACEKYVEGRKFTYINPQKIQSPNPGYCFKMAGWKNGGKNKNGKLIILCKD